MKKSQLILKSIFLMTLLSIILGQNNLNAAKGDAVEVQYIAIHYGNTDNATVIDESEFPLFSFYVAEGEVYSYYERTKMMKNPAFLKGYYGEAPEKMGFGSNAVAEKNKMFPFSNGCIHVVDPNGVVFYQLDNVYSNVRTNSNSPDTYDIVHNEIKGAIKSLRKGKVAKTVKFEEYLKSTPVSELEIYKGKIDKSQKGIEGWNVPDLKIKSSDGTETSLNELCKGKVTVLVFYSLNGTKRKIAQDDGTMKEIKCQKLINTKEYAANAEDKMMNAASPKDFFKQSAKMATASSSVGGLFNSEEELDERKKAELYKKSTELVRLVTYVSESIK